MGANLALRQIVMFPQMGNNITQYGYLGTSIIWQYGCDEDNESGVSSGAVHVTRPQSKITWSVAKSPRVAEQCDVNIHSLIRSNRINFRRFSFDFLENSAIFVAAILRAICFSLLLYFVPFSNMDISNIKEVDLFNSCQVIYSQFGLAIHQNDQQARRRFVKWAQNEIAVVFDFHKRILFRDEAHFWLNGYVNKQNCRIWSEANPQVYVETPLHPEQLTVWCGALYGLVESLVRTSSKTMKATTLQSMVSV
ncbi:putative transposable element [Trichonephila clavipes]|nr:putative transposable element [Trichonephila clavipes]